MHLRKQILTTLCFVAASLGLIGASQTVGDKNPLAPFTSLCLEDQSNGFGWKRGAWEATQFKADKKYLIQKIAPEKYKEMGTLCRAKEARVGGNYRVEYGCYNMREMGEEIRGFTSTMCSETWENNALKKISCDEPIIGAQYFFLPDGNYIRFPWHSDIDQNPKDQYKDSLSISVGKCSVVSR